MFVILVHNYQTPIGRCLGLGSSNRRNVQPSVAGEHHGQHGSYHHGPHGHHGKHGQHGLHGHHHHDEDGVESVAGGQGVIELWEVRVIN